MIGFYETLKHLMIQCAHASKVAVSEVAGFNPTGSIYFYLDFFAVCPFLTALQIKNK